MVNLKMTDEIVTTILKASKADDNKLKSLRKNLIVALDKVGAKYFVREVAHILKNNFQIEGCNDVRIPLKRIFSISLEELEENLTGHKYNLPIEHPISLLSS